MGKIATQWLACGDGWRVAEHVCGYGPRDRPFEERHEEVTIAVVVAGTFQYRGQAGAALLMPGALLLGSLGRHFECRHEYGVGDRCIAFRFRPDYCERVGAPVAFADCRLPPLPALAPWVAAAHIEAQSERQAVPLWEEMALGLMASAQSLARTRGLDSRAPSAADERRISAVLRWLETDSEDQSLPALAAMAGMSMFHFLRVFQRVVGVSPHRYRIRRRLHEAARRLRSTREPVTAIALRSGFNDLSHFHHAFRAEFGASPRVYRQSKPRTS